MTIHGDPKEMNQKNHLLFVQFLHPGGECCSEKGNKFIEWNNKEHCRKFIKNYGRYLENNQTKEGDLVFWGEWEAQAKIIKNFENKQDKSLPKHLCEPFYCLIVINMSV